MELETGKVYLTTRGFAAAGIPPGTRLTPAGMANNSMGQSVHVFQLVETGSCIGARGLILLTPGNLQVYLTEEVG